VLKKSINSAPYVVIHVKACVIRSDIGKKVSDAGHTAEPQIMDLLSSFAILFYVYIKRVTE
jgi:hypothetical protein